MIASSSDLITVLRQYNPWWRGASTADLSTWRRRAFHDILSWMQSPPAPRALLLSGARQVGKTTLFLQVIQALIEDGVPANKILYAAFDHPLLKLLGLDGLLRLWREFEPETDGIEYLFLDEIQTIRDWQTWLKLQVDFEKKRRIAVTGSATPLVTEGQESGVGRWHTLRLSTLSFYEYLHLKKIPVPSLPDLRSLAELFDWAPVQFARVAADVSPMVAHFHEYLLRGGFPQSTLIESITAAQKLLREDIVDKVLKRDMTALFGVRHVLELEQVFLYLCLHGGGLLDMQALCRDLELKKPTVNNFINLLESTHLIYKLPPFGYGKEILRARYKVYLADPAIAPSVLLKGTTLLEDPTALGIAVETAFFKHVFARYYASSVGFSYWRGKRDRKVDIVAEVQDLVIPFEVKYRAQDTGIGDVKGLAEFCKTRKASRGYIITKDIQDFSILYLPFDVATKYGTVPARIAKVPAPLACYWLGKTELDSLNGS
ncbi:ATP-binding protein [Desulfofustis limnaeus]|jgi:predicted AAA+ superfamily ATPase|uniref:ATPase n=1 Tax=Desulfofustis limnaeus TaxID=2740163 RepID=A0ABM7WE11_9BACT|nr:ATP-binding protein [Desulfofustis limnaeus]MDX9896232.1 ATP-binding protein [Desulfofustis sp.]BDD89196.1 ATPase [Desulfofustis limnaeus]